MTENAISRLLRFVSTGRGSEPRECGYGDDPGALGNCSIILQPGEGVSYGGTVFCSEEHAALDQQEALF